MSVLEHAREVAQARGHADGLQTAYTLLEDAFFWAAGHGAPEEHLGGLRHAMALVRGEQRKRQK